MRLRSRSWVVFHVRCARKSFCVADRCIGPTEGYRAYLVICCFHIRRYLLRIGELSVVAYSIWSTVRLIFAPGGDISLCSTEHGVLLSSTY